MIAAVSCALALYEAVAIRTRRVPTVTEFSARRGTEVLVWGWFLCLGVHFLNERRSHGRIGH